MRLKPSFHAGMLLLFVFPAFAFLVACSSKQEVAVEAKAPEFRVEDAASGKAISSRDLKGKVLFVNFWATWCPPCKEEMPSIETLHRRTLSAQDFIMVTILYNDSPQTGVDYMKANGYTFPVYVDPGGASAKNFGVTGVPETYIIDRKGVLRKKVIGSADWASPGAAGFIDQLLQE